jgi:DNA-binding transcriptional regulator YiaG
MTLDPLQKNTMQQLESSSREALCFVNMNGMSNDKLSPLIQQLKTWRKVNELTQNQAVALFKAEGLPVTLDTLQNWEIGRYAPSRFAAIALTDFLKRHPKISKPRTK